MNPDDANHGVTPERPSLLDLALNQGRKPDLEALRAEVVRDPSAALEFGEMRQFVERMRGAAIEPSPGFEARMAQVVALGVAHRQRRQARPTPWSLWLASAVAAAALFAVLVWLDPLRLTKPRHEQSNLITVVEPRAPAPPVTEPRGPVLPPLPIRLAHAIAAAERMAADGHLLAALGRFQKLDAADRLQPWLAPRNAMAELLLVQERRAQSTARGNGGESAPWDAELAVALQGRLAALADELGAVIRSPEPVQVSDTATIVRALLASDHRSVATLRAGGERLAAAAPGLQGGALAFAVDALAALAATTGEFADVVADQGRRLVREVLEVEGETWVRRRPRLLLETTPVAELAAAGRFLCIAPEFGIEADEAMFVRLLLMGHLNERRATGNDGPEVPIALLHGFGDLLSMSERGELEALRRQWRPSALAPDFCLLHELASTYSPGRPGFARFRLDLRRINCLPTPASLSARAGLCLCLADDIEPPPPAWFYDG